MSADKLPDGWTRVRLGEVITRTSKRCTPEVSPSVRWIGADHLEEGDLAVRRWSTTDDPMFPPTFSFSVPLGSVLLHSRNPKKVAILPFDAITGEKLFCLTPVDCSALDSRFLAYQLQSDHFNEFVGRWLSGSVNKFLNWTALARYEFALPPIEEQQRIVALLSSLDRRTNALRQAAVGAASLASSLFDSLVVTTGVAATHLGKIAEWRRGYSFKGSDYAEQEGFPFLTLASVARGGGYRSDGLKYLKSELKPSCVAASGDLLIANTDLTPGREFIGRPFLLPESLGVAGFSHHLSFISVQDESLREWLYWEMQSPASRRFVRSVARGSTVIMLDMKAFGGWVVRIPPPEVRSEILRQVNAATAIEHKIEIQKDATTELRSRLLSSLLGGIHVQ